MSQVSTKCGADNVSAPSGNRRSIALCPCVSGTRREQQVVEKDGIVCLLGLAVFSDNWDTGTIVWPWQPSDV